MIDNRPFSAGLTTRQFLFYEMRTTAELMDRGLSEDEMCKQIVSHNLFQYPSEKSLRRIAGICIHRLQGLHSPQLVHCIVTKSADTAKLICLYALMRESRLVFEFMRVVIGEKFRTCNYSFKRSDVNAFFIHLQEQNDNVAQWSDQTVTKLKQVLVKCLVDAHFLENTKSTELSPVIIPSFLVKAIETNGDESILVAFNKL